MSTDPGTTNGGTVAATAVQKVLFLPELLEKILEKVHLCDIFRASAVCRTWKLIFEASHALKIKAQMKEDLMADWFEDEFDEDLGLRVYAEVPNPVGDGLMHFFFEFVMDEHRPIRLTTNLRKCLAAQPACKVMSVEPWCCPYEPDYISRDTGLTIGDLVDAARRVYAEHENCPNMVQKERDPRFKTSRYPRFRAKVRFPDGHLLRERAKKKQEAVQAWAAHRVKVHEDAGWGDIWYEFRHARRAAAATGQDLPRWPAFLAANKHLAPPGYHLSPTEASAADFPTTKSGSNITELADDL